MKSERFNGQYLAIPMYVALVQYRHFAPGNPLGIYSPYSLERIQLSVLWNRNFSVHSSFIVLKNSWKFTDYSTSSWDTEQEQWMAVAWFAIGFDARSSTRECVVYRYIM